MKNRVLIIIIAVLVMAMVCAACNNEPVIPNPPEPPTPIIEIIVPNDSLSLKDEQVAEYDFTSLFDIKVDGVSIEVLASYLDLSALTDEEGEFDVVCSYEDVSAKVTVTVTATVYILTCDKDEITLNQSLFDTYDYKLLFALTKDGVAIPITEDMITSDVEYDEGTYSYTVTCGKVSKTLTVNITSEHLIEVIPAFKSLELSLNEFNDYDFTELFSLYIDGKAEKTLPEMLQGIPDEPEIDEIYTITFTYIDGKTTATATIDVKAKANDVVVIAAKNISTYPNGDYIDVTKLFTIKIGDQVIPVTADMISGTIDYSKEGENEIFLTYGGQTEKAVVSVVRGVVIRHTKGDTIIIRAGTSKVDYAFVNDFAVIINGNRFDNLLSYLDISNVNFDVAGEYVVTIKIPYAYYEDQFGLISVDFEYFEEEITYIVLDVDYSITIKNEAVNLPKGTTTYNVYSNLSVSINGRQQTLTENPLYVDFISCYAQTVSDPINFSVGGKQEVRVAIYVFGVDKDPVIATYYVQIQSDIVITALEITIFSGDSIYARDLFSVTVGGESVVITDDMVSGVLNLFKPGVYSLTLEYMGESSTSKVVVYDSKIKGVYRTTMKTIEILEKVDPDGEVYVDGVPPVRLSNLTINDKGQIFFGTRELTFNYAIDENSMCVSIGTSKHFLHFVDGIAFLEPENSVRGVYYNLSQPILYFNVNLWTIDDSLQINSSDLYVLLKDTSQAYSIDAMHISAVDGSKSMWYVLNTEIIVKANSNTVYKLSWGAAEMSENFAHTVGNIATITFAEKTYKFEMTSSSVAKIQTETTSTKYANMTFNGMLGGKGAILSATAHEGFTLTVDGNQLFNLSLSDLSGMKYGGTDYENDILLVYSVSRFDNEPIFSYKFKLDVENNTFVYLEKDEYYGKFICGNKYVFLDGYGRGVISFDTSSSFATPFTYTVNGGIVTMNYFNTDSNFTMGKYALMHFDIFNNMLFADYFAGPALIGLVFENRFITDGAIVRFASFAVGQESETIARPKLFDNIAIITKDGVVTAAIKEQLIDTTKIRFSTPGFYQLIINIPMQGQIVSCYYAVQVLAKKYANEPLAKAYGQAVINPSYSLSIDIYGQVIFIASGTIYRGIADINGNDIVIKANSTNGSIVMNASKVVDGTILLRCMGALVFTDYFTTGSNSVTGIKGFVLRRITVSNVITYILCASASATGKIVEVTAIVGEIGNVGSIFSIKDSDSITVVKLIAWGNTTDGLALSDAYRGTYTLAGSGNLVLDGFGNASLSGTAATYTVENSVALVVLPSTVKVCQLIKAEGRYELIDIVLDESLLSGKTYSASYNFFVGMEPFNATTTFTFNGDKTVTITSQSSEYSKSEGTYKPDFVTGGSVTATYSVSGNRVTISVAGKTIVFIITNVINTNEIVCYSTNFDENSIGYIKTTTVFSK